MGKVTDELISLISRQVQDHGIVIWYDPEGVYQNLVKNLSLPETTIFTFEGSFFDLRWQLEPFIEFVDEEGRIKPNPDVPPKLLVYVPLNPSETNHALVEVEKAGVVMAPGASPWQRNTRLKVIAERVLKKIAPDQVKEISRGLEAGRLTLEDLDRLAHAGEEVSTLRLVFGTTAPIELALKFLCQEEFDPKIAEKEALPELCRLFQSEYGLSVSSEGTVEKVRSEFAQSLLLAELAIKVEEEGDATGQLSSIPVPQDGQQRRNLLALCRAWRNRLDFMEKYASFAYTIEKEGGLRDLELDPSSLKGVETFAFVETVLLGWAEDLVLKGDARDALEIADRRRRTFWLEFEPELQIRWKMVEQSASLILAAKRVEEELKAIGSDNPGILIEAYCTGLSLKDSSAPFPWYLLDRYHRYLEYYFSKIEQTPGKDFSRLEKMVFRVRRCYTDVVGQCAMALAEALKTSGFEIPGVLRQLEVFGKFVGPSLAEGKTAYILVDALRYEMGLELVEGLMGEFQVEIKPAMAQLPTITEVGMAALMPRVDGSLELVEGRGGKVGVRLGTSLLKDRQGRIKYFQSLVPKAVALKLGNIARPTSKQKEAIRGARMILVTSQELDHLGESMEDEDEARRLMEDVREKLRRGIRQLAALGVKRIVLAADHGHLFLEKPDEGMKLDPPGGNTVDLHPRVWIGRGGSDSPGCLRVSAGQVGLDGDLELVFPPGVACFKARGPDRGYLHGGISFQELLIPVALIEPLETADVHERTTVKLEMTRARITNRLFTVRVIYKGGGVFDQPVRKVKIIAWANRTQVGEAVAAEYGEPQEVSLEKGKPNVITMRLYDDIECNKVSIRVLDAKTQVELGALKDIEVDIAI